MFCFEFAYNDQLIGTIAEQFRYFTTVVRGGGTVAIGLLDRELRKLSKATAEALVWSQSPVEAGL